MHRHLLRAVALLCTTILCTQHLFAQHRWTRLSPQLTPRGHGAMTYDTDREVVVLVCPDHQTTSGPNRHYEWDGKGWIERTFAQSPNGQHLAYDRARRVMVCFDGRATWEFDNKVWTQQNTTFRANNTAVAWDGNLGQVIMFGGDINDDALETFAWDGASWQNQRAGSPPFREQHELCWDSLRRRVVLFGGVLRRNDTWEWDGATWVERQPASPPPWNNYFGMAFHERIGRVIVSGGDGFRGENWHWDGRDWHGYGTLGAPSTSAGIRPRMAYHAKADQVVTLRSRTHNIPVPIETWVYTASQHTPALTSGFGSGCRGSAGVPELRVAADPYLGYPMRLELNDLPGGLVNQAFFLFGGSNTSWAGAALPASLQSMGAPGCALLVRPDVMLWGSRSASSATISVEIPPSTNLLGLQAFVQGFVLDARANALGVATSNGVSGTVGRRF